MKTKEQILEEAISDFSPAMNLANLEVMIDIRDTLLGIGTTLQESVDRLKEVGGLLEDGITIHNK